MATVASAVGQPSSPPPPPPQDTKALKFDTGKYRMSLLPLDSIERVAQVGTMGAQKYGDGNWLKGGGMEWGRLYDAAMRHLFAVGKGEVLDTESGLDHLAHAAWNCLALMHYQRNGIGINNLFGEKNVSKEAQKK